MMERVSKTPVEIKIRHLSVGQHTFLDAGVPNGLFEADNGNRYLITHDDGGYVDRKFAIVLQHFNLQRFSTLELTDQKLESGTWRGPYRLRLYHSFRGEAPVTEPGYVGVCVSGEVVLRCCGKKSHPDTLAIGNVGQKNGGRVCSSSKNDWCDFDGWAIEPSDAANSFFNRAPCRQRTWLLNVKAMEPRQA
jgi:hypothetical protein